MYSNTSANLHPPHHPSCRPSHSKYHFFQTKEMKAEVEIGQHRSSRQFAVDTLNPRRMTTLAFFRVVRRMIEVHKKRNPRPKSVVSAVCVCVTKERLKWLIRNLRPNSESPPFRFSIKFGPVHN